jgi:hypothetical protein
LLQGSSVKSKKQQQHSVQEQMSALWSYGVTCFDVDVVQLAGGDFVIGHPADLAHKASSSSSNVAPDLLHEHDLAELRAAGVDAAAAPALHTILRHFAQLRRSRPPGSSNSKSKQHGRSSSSSKLAAVSVVDAAENRDSWQQVPLLALELKGPASISVEAWQDVISAVKSAGIEDSTVLWLRQPAATLSGPGTAAGNDVSSSEDSTSSSSSSSSRSVVLQLAQSLRKHTGSTTKRSTKSNGPLLGLIVPDKLMPAIASFWGDNDAPVG